jgi:diaminopimelate decarboxylase
VLDVGGSLGVPTTRYLDAKEIKHSVRYLVPPKPPQPEASLGAAQYAATILKQVHAHFDAQGLALPQIIAEPGRALTANAQMLITSVENIRKSDDFDFAVLDAGVSVASIVTSEYHAVLPLREGAEPARCHRLVGPICHMGDTLFPAQYLSPLKVGDALAIQDSGAYFIADASSFSFPQPAVVALTRHGDMVKVRERESFEHLVSLDHFTRS